MEQQQNKNNGAEGQSDSTGLVTCPACNDVVKETDESLTNEDVKLRMVNMIMEYLWQLTFGHVPSMEQAKRRGMRRDNGPCYEGNTQD